MIIDYYNILIIVFGAGLEDWSTMSKSAKLRISGTKSFTCVSLITIFTRLSEREKFFFALTNICEVNRELFESALFRLHTLSCSYNSVNIVTNGTTRKNCRRWCRAAEQWYKRVHVVCEGRKRSEIGESLWSLRRFRKRYEKQGFTRFCLINCFEIASVSYREDERPRTLRLHRYQIDSM